MTEAEWNSCTDPQKMLEFVSGKVSDRKLRLFAVACSRFVWQLLIDDRSRVAVEVAESYADGLLLECETRAAFSAACDASLLVRRNANAETMLQLRRHGDPGQVVRAAVFAAFAVGTGVRDVQSHTRGAGANVVDARTQARLLREIFGPPRCLPVTHDPAWLTSTVVSLAQAIYDERAFDRMPVLADALEESGCTNQDMLNHCRREGVHVRGCWAVDLVLGKQ